MAQGTLLSVMWQPPWDGVWGRMDSCVCMAESLCYSPETITTLLIGYTSIQNKCSDLVHWEDPEGSGGEGGGRGDWDGEYMYIHG